MRFTINPKGVTEQRSLVYNADDYSFDTIPTLHEADLTLALNRLNLTVYEGRVAQVWGLCSYNQWTGTNQEVPNFSKGSLEFAEDREPGFSYRVNNDDWPMFVNAQKGWVCIGDCGAQGDAVEFMTGCVAVLDEDSSLVSLWLKPAQLPKL